MLPDQRKSSDEFNVPIINLSDISIADKERSYLKHGLQHSYVNKNKKTKLNIAAEFESLLLSVNSSVTVDNKEEFHHFLRCSTSRFAQNIFHTQDYTRKTLYNLSSNPDIAVLQGDKDSTVVILRRDVYNAKIQAIIEEGLLNEKYMETTDNTISDLQNFQNFL